MSLHKSFAVFLFAGLLAFPPGSLADRGHKDHRHHVHKARVHAHRDYVRVVVRGRPYYYAHGHYYRHQHRHYVLTAPPIGVVVTTLPAGFVRLRSGPHAFFYYGGAYYRAAPKGYVVISKPDTVYVEKAAETAKEPAPFVEPVADTVMVMNTNGSKTPVRLESLDAGRWQGMRGEIYDSLPGQAQLHPVYGF